MKLSTAIIALSLVAFSNAFVIPPASFIFQRQSAAFVASPLQMSSESDFVSAMPEKPQQTVAEKLEESATTFIASFTERLGEGVDPPPELDALKEARDSGATPEVLTARIYELMLEQGMLYDIDPETGIMTPTEWDIKENLDEPNVKKEFFNLYSYGMNLAARGLIGVEELKEIVTKRLIERTGKTPEEFDEWLGF